MDWPQFRAAEPVKGTSAANNMNRTTWRVAETRTHGALFPAGKGFTRVHRHSGREIKSHLGCFLSEMELDHWREKSLRNLSAC